MITSCNRKKEIEIQHVTIEPGQTAEDVFAKGKKRMKQKRFEEAIEQFEALKNHFPYSPLAIDSELNIAESYFRWKKYVRAAETYGLFRRLHPQHPQAPFALLKQGESYALEAPETIDRDLSYCRQAVATLDQFFVRYQNHELIDKAREISFDCQKKMAGKEFYIGRFYYRTKEYDASVKRLESVLKNHSGFGYDEKAAWYLGMSHYKLKNYQESKAVWQQLVERFPQGDYADKAQDKLSHIEGKQKESRDNG